MRIYAPIYHDNASIVYFAMHYCSNDTIIICVINAFSDLGKLTKLTKLEAVLSQTYAK